MNRFKKYTPYVLVVFGLLLTVGGLILLKLTENPQGIMKALPYVCVGIGCGIFGGSMGTIITGRVMRKHPELERQQKIIQNDERNIAIANKAKAKAYDIMVYVFSALMLSFALMGVDMTAVLMLVLAYLFVIGSGIYFRVKYDKEL